MIYFDVTKTGRAQHRSGLNRVSACLRQSLGAAASEVIWADGLCRSENGRPVTLTADDWFFTSELFSEDERPGFSAFLRQHGGRTAAVFHDAIPLKHPHITWPQSVARHPGYMKLLGQFGRVWAVSAASREELRGFWAWQGLTAVPAIDVLALGADAFAVKRVTAPPASPSSRLMCVGIVEPRKNQHFLLDVCAALWAEGLAFELHLVGRVNPHFGAPIRQRLKQLQRTWRSRLFFHESADDATVQRLFASARASVFPTIAEGCGLPLLESLWMGTPCVCSDLPVLRENADGGGCLAVPVNDFAAWRDTLRRVVTDDALQQSLASAARSRPLPTWAAAGQSLLHVLR